MQSDIAATERSDRFKRFLFGRRPKVTLLRAAILLAACFVVFRFILLPVRINGDSMLPTYHTGQINCVNRLAYVRHRPQRYDIVSVRLARPNGISAPKVLYMKRIIGLPGETVAFHEGKAIINGNPIDEPYVKWPCDWSNESVTCGPDEYYVVGDNRSMTMPSHVQGRAKLERIVGKLLL